MEKLVDATMLSKDELLQKAEETIRALMDRVKEQEKTTLDGYSQAYDMIKNLQVRNATIEVELYEEYEKKLSVYRDWIINKIDCFLNTKSQEWAAQGGSMPDHLKEFRSSNTPEAIFHKAIEPKVFIGEMGLTVELIERAMNLPPNVRIVSVKETEVKGSLRIKYVTDDERLVDADVSCQEMRDIGDMFVNPEKYRYSPKGCVRGHQVSGQDEYIPCAST